MLALRAGHPGNPGLSPSATARVLRVSPGHEARLERLALSSLLAAGRGGCSQTGVPTVMNLGASGTLVATSPVFAATGQTATTSPAGTSPAHKVRTRGVTRGSVHRPGARPGAPTRTVDSAVAGGGAPAWAVIVALGLLALGGALALFPQVRGSRRIAGGPAGDPGSAPAAAASAMPVAAAAAPPTPEASSPPRPAPAPRAPSPRPASAVASAPRPARHPTQRMAAMAATAVAEGLMRLFSRRRTRRRRKRP